MPTDPSPPVIDPERIARLAAQTRAVIEQTRAVMRETAAVLEQSRRLLAEHKPAWDWAGTVSFRRST